MQIAVLFNISWDYTGVCCVRTHGMKMNKLII